MEKKKISNSAELNNYYKIINNKLKKYADMDIPPHKMAAYLRPGTQNFNNFISEDDELKDVDGIEVVLKDIIEDNMHAFRDGLFKKMDVKKFENYLITEGIFSKLDITDAIIHQHEKALADIYRISISSVDLINKEIHLYSVNDDGTMRKVMVFTQEEISKIKEEIVNILLESTKNKHYKFIFGDFEENKVLGQSSVNKQLPIKDVFNYDKAREMLNEMITEDDVIKTIARNANIKDMTDIEVEFKGKKNLNSVDYFLFEVNPERSATS